MVVVLPAAAVVSPVPRRSAGAPSSSHDGRLLDGLLRRGGMIGFRYRCVVSCFASLFFG